MPFHHHTLRNGLTIIAETSPSALSCAAGFFVRTGSRDEEAGIIGTSHFLEHMAFKGSNRRTAFDVNRDFDRIGADYNAYTSEESTVYYASLLPEYLPQGIDLLADLLVPVLRQEDFDMEKKVIINEIGRYEDMPHHAAYDRAQRAYFGDHALGNSILGTPEGITALTREQMEGYYRRRYVAPNVTLAVAGNVDFAQVVALAEQHCGSWPSVAAARANMREAVGPGTTEVVVREKVAQEYVVMMSPGPAASSPLRHAADILSMVVGDDSGSRLYWELVHEGLVDSASCSFREYEDTGVYYTSVSCDPEDAAENLALVREVLEKVQAEGITAQELDQARNKHLSRIVRSGEKPRGRMSALGTNWQYYGTYKSIDEEMADYEKVTVASVREVLDRYPLTRLTTLGLGPCKGL